MTNLYKKLATAALVISFSSLTMSLFNFSKIFQPSGGKIEVAGTIRSVNDRGWFVINDDAHTPINIDHVTVRKGVILINFAFNASKIHTFVVTPDETFAMSGYFVGASVVHNHAAIIISKEVNGSVVPVDASLIKSKLGNFWVYGLFTVNK